MTTPSVATCPRCNSASIQAVPIPRKNVAASVLAELALGTAAGVSAGSDTVIQVLCLKCGCTWLPGTKEEFSLRALSGQMGEDAQRLALAERHHLESPRSKLTRNDIQNIVIASLIAAGLMVLAAIAMSE